MSAYLLQTTGRRLRLDGISNRSVDVSQRVRFTGVFEPLREPAYFAQVRVDPELGTIGWPNGADLDPDVLYSQITGEPILVADPPNIMPRISTAAR